MKIRSLLGTLLIFTLLVTPAFAEESLEERVKKLEDALKKTQDHESREVHEESLEERVKKLEDALKKAQEHESREVHVERSAPPATEYPQPTGPMTDVKVERKGEEKVPLGFGTTGSGKLTYAKPFLSAPKATLGGYVDVMYNILDRRNLDNPSRNSFGQQRLVPFIYADITDRVKFAAELEMERGGTDAPQSGDGSIKIEFAQLDYLVNEMINVRGGILLMPVGKFNLLHDSPLNDLVDRPIVSRLIIPSTWFESGAGIYGSFYPTTLSKIDYELYAVNGVSSTAGAITDLGLRSIKGSVSRDRDDSKGVVGRMAFSPRLGIEVAASGYHSQYRPSMGAVDQSNLSIFAVDWTLQRGPFELIGEAAWAWISNNGMTGVATREIGPGAMQGYYVQGNYHFMPEILRRLAPTHFTEASTFTFTIRWDSVDTDTDNRTLANAVGNQRELERLTVGFNFRPIEDTVFKVNWQHNTQNGAIGLVPGGDKAGSGSPIDGNGFLFQVATYF